MTGSVPVAALALRFRSLPWVGGRGFYCPQAAGRLWVLLFYVSLIGPLPVTDASSVEEGGEAVAHAPHPQPLHEQPAAEAPPLASTPAPLIRVEYFPPCCASHRAVVEEAVMRVMEELWSGDGASGATAGAGRPR
jgi:hypothetical protein